VFAMTTGESLAPPLGILLPHEHGNGSKRIDGRTTGREEPALAVEERRESVPRGARLRVGGRHREHEKRSSRNPKHCLSHVLSPSSTTGSPGEEE
jgi:hypothetical protein